VVWLPDRDIDWSGTPTTQRERRVLIDELVEWVTVVPDHLEVTTTGSSRWMFPTPR
jgi:hypothetical protein